MTEKTRELIAQVERELEARREEDQDQVGELLLEALRRASQTIRPDPTAAPLDAHLIGANEAYSVGTRLAR